MERVETLVNKLQTEVSEKASISQLLRTTQLLQAELQHLQNNPNKEFDNVFINHATNNFNQEDSENTDEKTISILQIDDAEIEAELEEIKKNAELIQQLSGHNKPPLIIDDEGLPQKRDTQFNTSKEINESIKKDENESINEKLKKSQIALSEVLTDVPIKDLKKAIEINDKFLFINELFRGDEIAYERSLKTINSFSIYPEAAYWIERELKLKNGWDNNNEVVQQFYAIVKRKFL